MADSHRHHKHPIQQDSHDQNMHEEDDASSSSESEAPTTLDLGPRWTQEELHIFFDSKKG